MQIYIQGVAATWLDGGNVVGRTCSSTESKKIRYIWIDGDGLRRELGGIDPPKLVLIPYEMG